MNKKTLLTAITGVLLTVCLIVSCGGELNVKLPSAAKANALPDVAGTKPATAIAAYDLLEDALSDSNFGYAIGQADFEILNAAYKTKNDVGIDKLAAHERNSTSFSESFTINETSKFKDEIIKVFSNYEPNPVTVGDASLKGSHKLSYKSNRKFGDLYLMGFKWANGDNLTSSETAQRDIKITNYKYTDDTTYTISAIISITEEIKEDAKYRTSDYIGKVDSTATNKRTNDTSIALSISDGTTGAKYRFSLASVDTKKYRSAAYGENIIRSDIEVYDNSNKLIFTLQGEADSFLDSFLHFTYSF